MLSFKASLLVRRRSTTSGEFERFQTRRQDVDFECAGNEYPEDLGRVSTRTSLVVAVDGAQNLSVCVPGRESNSAFTCSEMPAEAPRAATL